jgi:predicted TIM-barrel fold metal-dependent hydrolase
LTVRATDATSGPYRRSGVPSAILNLGRRYRARRALGPQLGRYTPQSMLELPSHHVRTPVVPVVDAHAHLGRWLTRDGTWMEEPGRVLDLMDECHVRTMVNLDGRWGAELEENLDRYDRAWPGRFVTFCHLDWSRLETLYGPASLVRSLEMSAAAGARGIKVWKDLGLSVRAHGRLILPDDSLLAPVWEAAGELGLVVLIHVGDPKAYFTPIDCCNERFEDLLRNPGNSQSGVGLEGFRRLLDGFENLVASHPGTTFVGAHVGGYPENLRWVGNMLARYPNLYIDVSGRAAELGRQPRAAADLITTHADRVLFGSDSFPLDASAYRLWYRMLETADEAFEYSEELPPPTGRWTVSGLDLARPVLEKVYAANAVKLLGLEDDSTRLQPLDPPGVHVCAE